MKTELKRNSHRGRKWKRGDHIPSQAVPVNNQAPSGGAIWEGTRAVPSNRPPIHRADHVN